jgi:hypothetical protein
MFWKNINIKITGEGEIISAICRNRDEAGDTSEISCPAVM